MNPFYPFFIVLLASLRFFFSFGLSSIFDPLQPYLTHDFNLSTITLGGLSSLFFYAEAALIIPAGLMLDRISPRKLTSWALVLAILGLIMMANAQNIAVLIVARLLMGMGAGLQFAGCVRVIVNWLKDDWLGRGMAMLTTVGMLGGVIAQTPFAYLIKAIGWRDAIYIVAVIGMLIAMIAYLYVPDHPKGFERNSTAAQVNVLSIFQRFKLAFVNKQNLLSGIHVSLMNLPVFMLAALWGVAYLTNVNRVSGLQASSICSMIFIGCIVGFPLMGALSDHIKRRVLPMQWGAGIALILVLLIMHFHSTNFGVLMFCYFLLGFVTSSQVIAFPLVLESNSRGISSSASSVISIISILGGAISQPIFGYIVAHRGYEDAMWLLPLAFILAFGVSYALKETYCRSKI